MNICWQIPVIRGNPFVAFCYRRTINLSTSTVIPGSSHYGDTSKTFHLLKRQILFIGTNFVAPENSLSSTINF